MESILKSTIEKLIEEGENVSGDANCTRWWSKVVEYLRLTFGESIEEEFKSRTVDRNPYDAAAKGIGYLQGLNDKNKAPTESESDKTEVAPESSAGSNKRVFIVHGRNNEMKETVARFIEKLGLDAIILHEQANSGRTIIEKLEDWSTVAMAVVLLTPDDVGREVSSEASWQPRARQNVVFELGYFTAKLSRKNVCALYVDGVELPSNFYGVAYVPIDSAGAWRTKLAQEFVEARMPIDLKGIL